VSGVVKSARCRSSVPVPMAGSKSRVLGSRGHIQPREGAGIRPTDVARPGSSERALVIHRRYRPRSLACRCAVFARLWRYQNYLDYERDDPEGAKRVRAEWDRQLADAGVFCDDRGRWRQRFGA